ncbi:MAG: hypothetical protein KAU21_17720, partial [Gammaproteobacteria bacterium]|nr:hypothetical protein [Gammaproteobacteria bacterium]
SIYKPTSDLMLTKLIKFLAAISLLFLYQSPIFADADLERTNLAKLVYEINFLLNRVDQIKQDSAEHQKWKFHYNILADDLKKIQAGINSHINQTLHAGRNIKPLSGHYEKKSIGHE